MNFLKKILGFNNKEENASGSVMDDVFSFAFEAQLLGFNDGEKQEMYYILRFLLFLKGIFFL